MSIPKILLLVCLWAVNIALPFISGSFVLGRKVA